MRPDDRAFNLATAEAVCELMALIPLDELAAFSRWVRSGFIHYLWPSWRLDEALLHELESLDAPHITLFWGLLSMHPSGYNREAVLGPLAKSRTGQELPFIMLRALDWVPEVRAPALEALRARITGACAPHFANALTGVVRLASAHERYSDVHAIVDSIHRLLTSPDHAFCLLDAMESDSRITRREAFRLAMQSTKEVAEEGIVRASASSDLALRLRAAEHAATVYSSEPLQAFCKKALRDPHYAVRRAALRTIAEHCPAIADEILHAALLDPHASLRAVARFHLLASDAITHEEIRALYRRALESAAPSQRALGLQGLSDVGTPDDVTRIAHYVSSEHSKTRRLAIQGLTRHEAVLDYHETLVAMLSDPVASVAAAARDALATHPKLLDGPALWEFYEQAPLEHTRRFAMHLLRRLPIWTRITYLLRIVQVAPDDALPSLQSWCRQANHIYTTMTDDAYEDAASALNQVRGSLPYTMDDTIAGLLEAKRSG
ncbi:hypothetical protein DV096_04510 [Bradymonadaceae bacterium TMQ3]|uniref:HEAT repeat domain-containing protein n=1 Tax=Lujinxingia sediminis TaxID=2480984 RepID=A0ABY0CXG0_9DELT|nr:hypothetical protein [Lujinxingia sediminis]RDV39831.1 hypothetical protein DV096_04510 [Bradymonadaceae bacterium TMQ3]RVU48125.1 hypothetical protein EA187_01420 [Lujinxingia sediminis]TXC77424.1 hypothetical protein FRC91_01425 [Bradymonadales bacterium TMQ1]